VDPFKPLAVSISARRLNFYESRLWRCLQLGRSLGPRGDGELVQETSRALRQENSWIHRVTLDAKLSTL